jgi:hypothetical protein
VATFQSYYNLNCSLHWRTQYQWRAVQKKNKTNYKDFNGIHMLHKKGETQNQTKLKLNSMVWVRKRTIPTERPRLVGEVIANFCGQRVPRGQRDGSLRPYSRFSRQEPLLFYQVAPQLYSRGWLDPVPDPLPLWPLDHRGGPLKIKTNLKIKSNKINAHSAALCCLYSSYSETTQLKTKTEKFGFVVKMIY